MKRLLIVIASALMLAACSSAGRAASASISSLCTPIASAQGFSAYGLTLTNTGSIPVTVTRVVVNFSNQGQSFNAISAPVINPGHTLVIPMQTAQISGRWTCALGLWSRNT